MNMAYFIGLSLLLTIMSCGSDNEDNDQVLIRPEAEAAQDLGQYRVNITTLNQDVSGGPSGLSNVTIANDEVSVIMAMNRVLGRDDGQRQYIYTLGSCPSEANDLNGDGIVDVIEGSSVFGQEFIPLDGDLNAQLAGIDEWPIAIEIGIYAYRETGVYSLMLADLATGENLNLENRTIVIHGLPDTVNLPPTVATDTRGTPHEMTPIACGEIERIPESI